MIYPFLAMLLSHSIISYAQPGDQPLDSNNVDQVSERNDTATVEKAEKTEEAEVEEKYEIYRKDNPENPCDRGLDAYDYEKSWYDESQIYINSKFCEPALYFDNFFANDRVFKEGVPGTYIRWRNDFSYDEEEYFKFDTNLSASFELPGAQSRLRLTLENDEDEDLRDIAPGTGDTTASTLGLQLDLLENVRSKINVTVSLAPRIRLRYRYTYPVFETVTMRFTQELQREEQVHSSRTLVDFEKLLKKTFLFRSSSEIKVSEEFDGADWLQAFVLYQRVDKKTSISYETSANGITQPLTLATNYRLGLRFRKNFHRKWLFYEIAPEMTWPVTFDEKRLNVEKDRRSKWLLFFRFEVHFGNASKKRYKDYN